ncbi:MULTISPECIES: GAF domain-containing protein [unclassified Pseudoclavibacter]|uniref:GAF domain-containing protein n=1 Tax=unclassified Pseudoclavibacter TaxID=2615177 RepID=UPI0013012583|nr:MULTISPECIES: GAF domain-containing protein [unclassified Pseudoclavibacter]KAB1644388.1 GAF domain-containing protein [Pseudoclavibacter sp. CFCC 14310]KAB1664110.1 GAF domain-containing protein [Pseudoclavibacter sp. CFCC 13611]
MANELESSFSTGEDPVEYDHLLQEVFRATSRGERAPARPRPLISASWKRSRRAGLKPDVCRCPMHSPVRARRAPARTSTTRQLIPLLKQTLPQHDNGMFENGNYLVVLTDAEARIVWRYGSTEARQRADRIGFVKGALWRESTVGTNAIGTALAVRHPVQVHGAEHFCLAHQQWSCAASPIIDPRSRACLGIVNISCTVAEAHPAMLALASLLAHTLEMELHEAHQHELERLRTISWPMQHTQGDEPWAVTDRLGWVAATNSASAGSRFTLPEHPDRDLLWLPEFGSAKAASLPGGWFIQGQTVVEAEPGENRLQITRTSTGAHVTMDAGDVHWSVEIPPRQVDVIAQINAHQDGVSAADLSEAIFGDRTHTVTVRAEVSRIRRALGPVIIAAPYRFAEGMRVEID